MDKTHTSLLLLTAAILCSFSLRLSSAQGNTASSNACTAYGRCGPFASCNPQDSPICTCLPGFSPVNGSEWASGNWTSGCSRKVRLGCEQGRGNNGSREDGFLKLDIMNITRYTHWIPAPENQCQDLCLRNCSCMAYAYAVGGGNCLFWNRTLMDLQKSASLLGSDIFIRVANSELDRKKGFKKILILAVVVGFAFTCGFACFSWRWMAKRRGRKRRSDRLGKTVTSDSVDSSLQDTLNKLNLEDLPLFKFEILANATENFSEANKLGKGGFGPVYKGELANGRLIAIKRLSKASGQGMQEFMNEVLLISKLQHRNLVRLLGCCVESKETMLVYEYMPNKSLDFYLFDHSQEILDWRKRFKIIEGICRGLLYLHRDSRLKIMHRDLKPSNILLDNDWNSKISDFGMARIYGNKEDHISTVRVVGTYGYMAPEYAIKGRFSEKSDVFSFGVVMLEIATGRRNNHGHSFNLLAHIWQLWKEDNLSSSIDPRISNPGNETSEVVRCIHIGLLCVQELPEDRPSVSSVLSMLGSEILELRQPKQPAFVIRSRSSHAGTSSSQQSNKSSCSVNQVTLTAVDGR